MMNKKEAFKNLRDVTNILQTRGIIHWIEAGTCLGSIRENDFIEHDNDIDIGIFAEDVSDTEELVELFKDFLDEGFQIYHTFGKLEKGFEIALMREKIKVDIFWFYKQGDKRWHAAWLNGGRHGESDMIKYVFEDRLFDKARSNLPNKGIIGSGWFNIPYPAEEYLEARYGTEWKIPNKRWRWESDPKCIDQSFNI